jgi:hypothetical protein
MSKLVESIIGKDYKAATDAINEQIVSIVERKMCEMKKMMSARDSIKEEELTESRKKKVHDPAKTAQQLALTMMARNQGKKVKHPPIKPSTKSDLAKESKKAAELHTAMRIAAGQQKSSDASRRREFSERQRRITSERIQRLVQKHVQKNFPRYQKVNKSTLLSRLKSIVGIKNEELMLPSGKVMVATGETTNQSVIKQRRGQV